MGRLQFWCGIVARMTALFLPLALAPARAAEEPDLIFKRSTVFKWLSPNDKLATYGQIVAACATRAPARPLASAGTSASCQ
jgi:hypothetical protein